MIKTYKPIVKPPVKGVEFNGTNASEIVNFIDMCIGDTPDCKLVCVFRYVLTVHVEKKQPATLTITIKGRDHNLILHTGDTVLFINKKVTKLSPDGLAKQYTID